MRREVYIIKFIEGVEVRSLKAEPDERGFLMEMLRCDWPEFMKFSQAYITACYPGVVKAWHYHKLQWDHFVCISGMARTVLCDLRDESPTQGLVNVFHLGFLNPILLKIPPLVYHGFASEGNETSLIVNFPTELYHYSQPDEYRLPYNDPSIPYSWEDISR